MNNLQKWGGIAALIEALAYIVGFVLMIAVFLPMTGDEIGPSEKLDFLLANKALHQVWISFIYIVFGAFLVVLAIALHERLKTQTPHLMSIATAFALIWAGLVIAAGFVANVGLDSVAKLHESNPEQAVQLWQSIQSIHHGLGGGVELVGGLWVLLVSLVAQKSSQLPKVLNYLGYVVGAAGILTIVPILAELGAVFGLGQIAWFIWLGIAMLRGNSKEEGAV